MKQPTCRLAKDGSKAYLDFGTLVLQASADEMALLLVNVQTWQQNMVKLQRETGVTGEGPTLTVFRAEEIEVRTGPEVTVIHFASAQGTEFPIALPRLLAEELGQRLGSGSAAPTKQ